MLHEQFQLHGSPLSQRRRLIERAGCASVGEVAELDVRGEVERARTHRCCPRADRRVDVGDRPAHLDDRAFRNVTKNRQQFRRRRIHRSDASRLSNVN
jgi:hypothetical protein